MPTEAEVFGSAVWADGPAVCLARILGLDGAYIQQSDISSISYTVYDLDNSSAVVVSGTFTVAATIYNTLQTGQIWTEDEMGYNFKATLPATCFPEGGRRYRVVFSFVTVSWGTISIPFQMFAADPLG
jgi:hypothetical protein